MDDFSELSQDRLADLADGLSASADLKAEAARTQMQTARDMHSIAAIASEMHDALTANTDEMRKMQASVNGAADRAEAASDKVFEVVERRAVRTLQGIDRAANLAIENSQKSANEAVEQLETARKAMVSTTIAVCSIACFACLLVLLVGIGAMWLQFQAGGAWLGAFGWAAILLAMAGCGALGYFIAVKKAK